MENASKALIIAGAILLAILIISLGILIFNQAFGVVANSNAMSEVEITQFNQKFTQYEGPKVRGATVKSLLQSVLSNNVMQDDDDRRVTVTGAVSMGKDSTSAPLSNISTGGVYLVECIYSDKGGNAGLVTNIKITQVK